VLLRDAGVVDKREIDEADVAQRLAVALLVCVRSSDHLVEHGPFGALLNALRRRVEAECMLLDLLPLGRGEELHALEDALAVCDAVERHNAMRVLVPAAGHARVAAQVNVEEGWVAL